MKNLKSINNKINKKVTENTFMMSYSFDICNIPPFMCSPYIEGLIWSENIIDITEYLFEVLISNYLITSISIFGDFEPDQSKEYSFDEAKEICSSLFESEDKMNALENLSRLYENFRNEKINYLNFIKMTIKLEQLLNYLDIELKTISYANPYEARYSDLLKTNKFDSENLENNF